MEAAPARPLQYPSKLLVTTAGRLLMADTGHYVWMQRRSRVVWCGVVTFTLNIDLPAGYKLDAAEPLVQREAQDGAGIVHTFSLAASSADFSPLATSWSVYSTSPMQPAGPYTIPRFAAWTYSIGPFSFPLPLTLTLRGGFRPPQEDLRRELAVSQSGRSTQAEAGKVALARSDRDQRLKLANSPRTNADQGKFPDVIEEAMGFPILDNALGQPGTNERQCN